MKQHIHLIGIGGSGLSSIARFLLESGFKVSGSDRALSPLAQEVAQAGAQVYAGHHASQIAGADLVVRSSAIPDSNPEVVAAQAAGIPVLKRAEFLEKLLAEKSVIAIAGTHGKTTTTAMTAWVLCQLGQDPSYLIGGVARNFNRNAHAGGSLLFVIEADEYDNMFLGLSPEWIILTVIEHDHPDCFPTLADYRTAFEKFIHRLEPDGTLFCNREDALSVELSKMLNGEQHRLTYGLTPKADLYAEDLKPNAIGGCDFTLRSKSSRAPLAQVSLQVPGLHNVRNALAVLGLVKAMKLDVTKAAAALGQFTGTARRFDLRGVASGISFIDDYAHHPTEIKATLAAARLRFPKQRIWAVWQPHTYSRTQTLLADFITAFTDADQVIVTEVYGAREASSSFSAADLVAQIPHPAARFAASLVDAASMLKTELRPGDVLLVLSAGDADEITRQVYDHYSHLESKDAKNN